LSGIYSVDCLVDIEDANQTIGCGQQATATRRPRPGLRCKCHAGRPTTT